jgi:uncharacterized protein with FMN-binding domain
MKRAPLLVFTGTVAGLIGVLTFHSRPPAQNALATGGARTGNGLSGASAGATPPAHQAASGSTRRAVGPSEQFGYGVLDVNVTVSGARITDVSVPTLQTADPTSQQISEQAIPMLRSEVLAAQSLNINAISGATYTSEAYYQSLQAALDKLHVR